MDDVLSNIQYPIPVHDPGFRANHRNPAQFSSVPVLSTDDFGALITQPGALIPQPRALVRVPVDSTRDREDFVSVPGILYSVPVQSPRQFVQQGRQMIVLIDISPESIRKTTFFQPLPRESNSVTGQSAKERRSFCIRLMKTAAA